MKHLGILFLAADTRPCSARSQPCYPPLTLQIFLEFWAQSVIVTSANAQTWPGICLTVTQFWLVSIRSFTATRVVNPSQFAVPVVQIVLYAVHAASPHERFGGVIGEDAVLF